MIARPRLGACVLSCAFGVLSLTACGEEGMSVNSSACDDLAVYDVVANRPRESWPLPMQKAYEKAEKNGCITPLGFAVTDPNAPRPPAATGGTGGSGDEPDAGLGGGGSTG